MKIYSIKEEYIKYLRTFDDKVCITKECKPFGRKYVGIVLKVESHIYFAPLTSRTTKIDKHTGKEIFRKNFTDIYLYDKNHSPVGAIKLNNMIPIATKSSELLVKLVDIENLINSNDSYIQKYGNLLDRQSRILSSISIQTAIFEKANGFYKMNDFPYKKYKNLCCDFKLLEQKAIEYSKTLEKEQEQQQERERSK